MIKQAIRNWLGITELHEKVDDMYCDLEHKTHEIRGLLITIIPGLGRAIVKLDPNYVKDELDPVRKMESDALGEAVIRKLAAEANERKKMTP